MTVRTIHAAKVLEFPIVVMANTNEGRFPPRSRGSSVVEYRDPVGLRQRKVYSEAGEHPHVYDDWPHDVIRRCLPPEYDGERRLLYVAVTRAESHVAFAAGETPNAFLDALPVEVDGRRVTVSIADLVHETADRVQVIDDKTDGTRRAQPEYEKQLDVYYRVLDEWFADKEVSASLFYTSDGTRERIDTHGIDELRALVRAAAPGGDRPTARRTPTRFCRRASNDAV